MNLYLCCTKLRTFLFTGNEFFHLVTGLSKEDTNRITIFSLVKAEELSTLYELIAEAIRKSDTHTQHEHDGTGSGTGTVTVPSSCSSKSGSGSTTSTTRSEGSGSGSGSGSSAVQEQEREHYKTIIVPCVKFPRDLPTNSNSNNDDHLQLQQGDGLFMSVGILFFFYLQLNLFHHIPFFKVRSPNI